MHDFCSLKQTDNLKLLPGIEFFIYTTVWHIKFFFYYVLFKNFNFKQQDSMFLLL